MAKTEVSASAQEDMAQIQSKGSNHKHLTGFRGILVISSFIWTFFTTFVPAVLPGATQGPAYQVVIRDVLGIFWNESLIYNAFILLSMRTIAISFLEESTGQVYAATVIRRIVHMVIIMSVASGAAALIFSRIGVEDIQEFNSKLSNTLVLVKTYDGLSAVNSLFNLFWLSSDFYIQAANAYWPTHTLWSTAIIYYQSWTVYFLMVFLPFTRPKWHFQILALFALGSFWMSSWGWYSATGLFFADLVIDKTLYDSFQRGIKLRDVRLPYWALATFFAAVGLALKYTFTVLPQYVDSELVLHPFLDLSETQSTTTAAAAPYARLDDWLIVVAIFIAMESSVAVRRALRLPPLLLLGQRSFSIFAAQSTIFWTIGIKLWLVLGLSTAAANAVVLVVCIAATAIFAEVFYRLIDLPAKAVAHRSYRWLTN